MAEDYNWKPVFQLPSNQVYMTRCHCKREVVKILIGNCWYTLCDVCYKDSMPNLSGMTERELALAITRVRDALGEANELGKRFINAMLVEKVCRKL
jgi:hypothetical protein